MVDRMTVDEFIDRIRKGERINCSNIQERNLCLILLDDLGFDVYSLDNHLDDIRSSYLYPGMGNDCGDDNDNEIVCWCSLGSSFIECGGVPFDEYYSTQECTKEEFDKDFKMLMGGV